jgi:hypothetical protein
MNAIHKANSLLTEKVYCLMTTDVPNNLILNILIKNVKYSRY